MIFSQIKQIELKDIYGEPSKNIVNQKVASIIGDIKFLINTRRNLLSLYPNLRIFTLDF